MSVSKWRYTEECDGDYCCGDCDLCDKEFGEFYNNEDEKVEEFMRFLKSIERKEHNDK